MIREIFKRIRDPASYIRASMTCKRFYVDRFKLLGDLSEKKIIMPNKFNKRKMLVVCKTYSNGWIHGKCIGVFLGNLMKAVYEAEYVLNHLNGYVYSEIDSLVFTEKYYMGKKDGRSSLYQNGRMSYALDYRNDELFAYTAYKDSTLECIIEYDEKGRRTGMQGTPLFMTSIYFTESYYYEEKDCYAQLSINDRVKLKYSCRFKNNLLNGLCYVDTKFDTLRMVIHGECVRGAMHGPVSIKIGEWPNSVYISTTFVGGKIRGTITYSNEKDIVCIGVFDGANYQHMAGEIMYASTISRIEARCNNTMGFAAGIHDYAHKYRGRSKLNMTGH
jgi:hypothetical protein